MRFCSIQVGDLNLWIPVFEILGDIPAFPGTCIFPLVLIQYGAFIYFLFLSISIGDWNVAAFFNPGFLMLPFTILTFGGDFLVHFEL